MFRSLFLQLVGSAVLCGALPLAAQETALDRYVAKPDANYSYMRYDKDDEWYYTNYKFKMVSQQWRNPDEVDRTVWEHDLMISVPEYLHSPSKRTALLLIDGGSNGDKIPGGMVDAVDDLAVAIGSVIAVVRQVPNQPLVFPDDPQNDRKEDEILAYSMDKFMQTGDEEWPVHLPMTKAVVRAMDTIQDYLAKKGVRIDDFIVFGASKRGWTTWLTAAVDPRIKAIMPISADLLNLREQFVHHWGAYGFYTDAIGDYAGFDIPCTTRSSRGQELWSIVDPYSYIERYTMPKLLISSAGDQFFLSDSSRFYYDQLPGPKHLRYTFNTDHRQGNSEDAVIDLLLSAMLWVDDINRDQAPPQFTWAIEGDGSTLRVEIQKNQPDRVYLWQAHNPVMRDFRLESLGPAWTKTRLDPENGVYRGQITPPAEGYTAYAIELQYDEEDLGALLDLTQYYTTEVQVIPDTLQNLATNCLADVTANFENPQPDSPQSGISVLSGWICEGGNIELELDDDTYLGAANGTLRRDTETVCGDTDNGFGLLYNFNHLANGPHLAKALVNGRKFGEARFNVTGFGEEFLHGVGPTQQLADFPYAGQTTEVSWQPSLQNFVITGTGSSQLEPSAEIELNQGISTLFHLENPQPGSHLSGIGVISGWACEAQRIDIAIDDSEFMQASYGTLRRDTGTVCGDTDNGFGLLYNMNRLGDGVHTLRMLIDGLDAIRVEFAVNGFGEEFLEGASGVFTVPGFPGRGYDTTLEWQQALQNFMISGYQPTTSEGNP